MSSNGFSTEQNEEIKKVLEGENSSRVTQQEGEYRRHETWLDHWDTYYHETQLEPRASSSNYTSYHAVPFQMVSDQEINTDDTGGDDTDIEFSDQDVSVQCSSRYEPESDILEDEDLLWLSKLIDELGID